MTSASFNDYHLTRPDAAAARRALACLLCGPERPGTRGLELAEREVAVGQFERFAASMSLNPERQVAAVQADRIVATCLWAPSPGRTALLFAPNLVQFPEAAGAAAACIRAAMTDAKQAGVQLVQCIVEVHDTLAQQTFAAAGMEALATLNYMERKPPLIPPSTHLPDGVTLEPYTPERREAFKAAIAASYEETLDCPRLSGVRSLEDTLAGHQAVGLFDPQLWSLVRVGGVPEGCLLLAEVPARKALEVVYLGLSPRARGKGIGRTLIHRTLSIASRRHMALTSLAVDAANGPAIRLYKRAGYVDVAQRIAMICVL